MSRGLSQRQRLAALPPRVRAEVQRILDACRASSTGRAAGSVIRSGPRPGATSARSMTARMRARRSSRVRLVPVAGA